MNSTLLFKKLVRIFFHLIIFAVISCKVIPSQKVRSISYTDIDINFIKIEDLNQIPIELHHIFENKHFNVRQFKNYKTKSNSSKYTITILKITKIDTNRYQLKVNTSDGTFLGNSIYMIYTKECSSDCIIEKIEYLYMN